MESLRQISRSSDVSREMLKNWDMNIWEYTDEELCHQLWQNLCRLNLNTEFHISKDSFLKCLNHIRFNQMSGNPFHNFHHLVDVAQSTFVMMEYTQLKEILRPLEKLALFVSAIMHDLDHRGFTNSFHVATGSRLAKMYRNDSVLEHHHCAEAVMLLSQEGCDIFGGLSADEKSKAFDIIFACILATDLAHHHDILNRWNERRPHVNKNSEHDRILLMQVVLKMADISNPTKPSKIAERWAHLLQQEFFVQGDTERALGLPVSKFMDRKCPQLLGMGNVFVINFVEPVLSSLVPVLPQLKELYDRVFPPKIQ